MSDATKEYNKGYAAGRRKTRADLAAQRAILTAIRNARGSMWKQVYLSLLPAAMQVQGWRIGDEKVTSGPQRVRLARLWADEAVKNMPGYE